MVRTIPLRERSLRGALLLLVLLLGGCASGGKLSGPAAPKPSHDPLPGSGRELPSEENRTAPGAPSAFPGYPADRSGAGTGAAVPDPPQASPADTRATRGTAPIPAPAGSPDRGAGSAPALPPTPRPRTVPPAPAEPPAVRTERGFYTVQLLVATSLARAEEWKAQAAPLFPTPVRIDEEAELFLVRVGMMTTAEAADELRRDAISRGYPDARVVPAGSRPEREAP